MKRFERAEQDGGVFLPGDAPAVRARASGTDDAGAGGGSSEQGPPANVSGVPGTPEPSPASRLERKWRSTAYLTIGIPPRAPWG